eukprot:COSAG04_NODE_2745_length_3649_cov_5.692676_4_plen_175_part_00
MMRRFEENEALVQSFQECLRQSQNLLEMASNPLLLALLIGVFTDGEKYKLPDRRTDLYEKGVGMMIAGGARNAKAARAVMESPTSETPTAKKTARGRGGGRGGGRGRGRAKRKTSSKSDVKTQTLHSLLCKIEVPGIKSQQSTETDLVRGRSTTELQAAMEVLAARDKAAVDEH